jgi:hypothetical protein
MVNYRVSRGIFPSLKWNGWGMLHVWGRGESYTGFWLGNLKEGDNLGDPGINRKMILRRIFRK